MLSTSIVPNSLERQRTHREQMRKDLESDMRRAMDEQNRINPRLRRIYKNQQEPVTSIPHSTENSTPQYDRSAAALPRDRDGGRAANRNPLQKAESFAQTQHDAHTQPQQRPFWLEDAAMMPPPMPQAYGFNPYMAFNPFLASFGPQGGMGAMPGVGAGMMPWQMQQPQQPPQAMNAGPPRNQYADDLRRQMADQNSMRQRERDYRREPAGYSDRYGGGVEAPTRVRHDPNMTSEQNDAARRVQQASYLRELDQQMRMKEEAKAREKLLVRMDDERAMRESLEWGKPAAILQSRPGELPPQQQQTQQRGLAMPQPGFADTLNELTRGATYRGKQNPNQMSLGNPVAGGGGGGQQEKSFLRGRKSVEVMADWQKQEIADRAAKQAEVQAALERQIEARKQEKLAKDAAEKAEQQREEERLRKDQELLALRYQQERELQKLQAEMALKKKLAEGGGASAEAAADAGMTHEQSLIKARAEAEERKKNKFSHLRGAAGGGKNGEDGDANVDSGPPYRTISPVVHNAGPRTGSPPLPAQRGNVNAQAVAPPPMPQQQAYQPAPQTQPPRKSGSFIDQLLGNLGASKPNHNQQQPRPPQQQPDNFRDLLGQLNEIQKNLAHEQRKLEDDITGKPPSSPPGTHFAHAQSRFNADVAAKTDLVLNHYLPTSSNTNSGAPAGGAKFRMVTLEDLDETESADNANLGTSLGLIRDPIEFQESVLDRQEKELVQLRKRVTDTNRALILGSTSGDGADDRHPVKNPFETIELRQGGDGGGRLKGEEFSIPVGGGGIAGKKTPRFLDTETTFVDAEDSSLREGSEDEDIWSTFMKKEHGKGDETRASYKKSMNKSNGRAAAGSPINLSTTTTRRRRDNDNMIDLSILEKINSDRLRRLTALERGDVRDDLDL